MVMVYMGTFLLVSILQQVNPIKLALSVCFVVSVYLFVRCRIFSGLEHFFKTCLVTSTYIVYYTNISTYHNVDSCMYNTTLNNNTIISTSCIVNLHMYDQLQPLFPFIYLFLNFTCNECMAFSNAI